MPNYNTIFLSSSDKTKRCLTFGLNPADLFFLFVMVCVVESAPGMCLAHLLMNRPDVEYVIKLKTPGDNPNWTATP